MLYYFLHPYCRIKLKLNSGSETTLLQGLSVNDVDKQPASKSSDSNNHNLVFLTILWVGCVLPRPVLPELIHVAVRVAGQQD